MNNEKQLDGDAKSNGEKAKGELNNGDLASGVRDSGESMEVSSGVTSTAVTTTETTAADTTAAARAPMMKGKPAESMRVPISSARAAARRAPAGPTASTRRSVDDGG